jgi:hypothetical protein
MFLVGILSWWYSEGLKNRFQIIQERFSATSDFFSIDLLFTTLFSPYRQISAEGSNSPILNDKLMDIADKLVSRVIGAIVRIFMIVFGLVAIVVQIIFGLLTIIIWLVIPLLPVIGLILAVLGWVPYE